MQKCSIANKAFIGSALLVIPIFTGVIVISFIFSFIIKIQKQLNQLKGVK